MTPPPPGAPLAGTADAPTLDPALPFGMVGYLGLDGRRLCAACGCSERLHCLVCGCRHLTNTPAECQCAKLIAAIPTCPHCGLRFSERWRLQNHLMPNPTCRTSAHAAAGRYAAQPTFEPPLRAEVH